MKVEFFEKPGCKGNAKQRARLEGQGYELDVKDLLATPWTADTLRPFFGAQPVENWFNKSAKKIKSGEIDPASFDEAAALACLVGDPMLIRRPLLRTEKGAAAGFQPGAELEAIGIHIPEDQAVGEGCQSTHPGTSCKSPVA